MKKFAQMTILIAGLAGLSACASNNTYGDYEGRTAGSDVNAQIAACQERVRRLEEMNKACYRK
jgi:N-methylhydantoinase B/oxoprolinase/acetone carboxylase alpha subunit